jgi:hypothetical protein
MYHTLGQDRYPMPVCSLYEKKRVLKNRILVLDHAKAVPGLLQNVRCSSDQIIRLLSNILLLLSF